MKMFWSGVAAVLLLIPASARADQADRTERRGERMERQGERRERHGERREKRGEKLKEKAAATEHGAELYPASVPGCGILGGQPIDLSGAPFKWSATCEREIPKYQTTRLAQINPDVVIWLSGWDRDDRLVDGQRVSISTMSGRAMFSQLIDQSATRLTSTGALGWAVVNVLTSIVAGYAAVQLGVYLARR